MTEDGLLQIIREWLSDTTHSTHETFCGLKNIRDLCEEWLPAMRSEAGDEP